MSVTKKASGRRSIKVKAPDSTQSAMERRSSETELSTLIARFAPAYLRLIGTMRRRLPTAHQMVYEYRSWFVISFSPSDRGYEGVLAIRASADGVKLYFNRGKELPDPEKLLRGSGGQVRSIEVEGASTLARPAVARLIDQAITCNRVPFARSGRGSVVIRTASPKQRRRRRLA